MSRIRTLQEADFLKYFRQIDKHAIKKILTLHRSAGPIGYETSLVLARILKVKERISSDRELSEKLTKMQIYREAIGIKRNMVPSIIRSTHSEADWGLKVLFKSTSTSFFKPTRPACSFRQYQIYQMWLETKSYS